MEPDGTGGTTTVSAIWRNGNGTVALPQAHDSAATTLCPGLGRGGEAAVAAGTRVFPVAGHVIHDEKLGRRRDLCGRYGAGNREVERSGKKATSHECSGGIHNPRGGAAARMYAEDGRAVPARCTGPALADPACGWFDGTITLSYWRIKNLSRG